MSAPTLPENYKELRTEVTANNELKLYLETCPLPELSENDVLIKVQASPINPSDIGLLLATADIRTLKVEGSGDDAVATLQIPAGLMGYVKGRIGESMAAGIEGAGTVVAAGANAQALMGKVVSTAASGMYSEYRKAPAQACIPAKEGIIAKQAASSFVNPMTVLAFIETMRKDGQKALINTAAASNLGRMLIKVCNDDEIPLVNIVRKESHVKELKALGAEHVCNSSDDDFHAQLVAAIDATGAMMAFDATGGGELADKLLKAMEVVAVKNETEYSRYGSNTHKQVYIYGGLDRRPTTLNRSYGLNWGVSGWLLMPTLGRLGNEIVGKIRTRVANEIDTTFASSYQAEISLADALKEETILAYAKQASGEKFLVCPSK